MTSTPYESLSAWLKEDPQWAACKYFRGEWKDLESQRNSRLVSILEDPGNIDVHQQSYLYSIVLVGPLDWESKVAELKALRDLMQVIVTRITSGEDYEPCGAAQIEVIGGIMGPGYTDTGRPWYGVTLQLLV
jgi:hypothetical protein